MDFAQLPPFPDWAQSPPFSDLTHLACAPLTPHLQPYLALPPTHSFLCETSSCGLRALGPCETICTGSYCIKHYAHPHGAASSDDAGMRISEAELDLRENSLKVPHGNSSGGQPAPPRLQAAKDLTASLKLAQPPLEAANKPDPAKAAKAAKAGKASTVPATPRLQPANPAKAPKPAPSHLQAAKAQPLPQGSPLLAAAAAVVV